MGAYLLCSLGFVCTCSVLFGFVRIVDPHLSKPSIIRTTKLILFTAFVVCIKWNLLIFPLKTYYLNIQSSEWLELNWDQRCSDNQGSSVLVFSGVCACSLGFMCTCCVLWGSCMLVFLLYRGYEVRV